MYSISLNSSRLRLKKGVRFLKSVIKLPQTFLNDLILIFSSLLILSSCKESLPGKNASYDAFNGAVAERKKVVCIDKTMDFTINASKVHNSLAAADEVYAGVSTQGQARANDRALRQEAWGKDFVALQSSTNSEYARSEFNLNKAKTLYMASAVNLVGAMFGIQELTESETELVECVTKKGSPIITAEKGQLDEALAQAKPNDPCGALSNVGKSSNSELSECFFNLQTKVTKNGMSLGAVVNNIRRLSPAEQSFFAQVMTVIGEARGVTIPEQALVMKTIENRMNFYNSTKRTAVNELDIALQPFQYSMYNPGATGWKKALGQSISHGEWAQSVSSASEAYRLYRSGTFNVAGNGTSDQIYHYHTKSVAPSWGSQNKAYRVQVKLNGNQINAEHYFYRNIGLPNYKPRSA